VEHFHFVAYVPLHYVRPDWQGIFWISYWAWALFEIWVFSRDRRAAHGKRSDGGSVFVIFFFITVAITTAFVAPYAAPWARIALPAEPVFYTAIGLIWFGLIFRLWAILTLGRFFRTSVLIHDDHKLVTSGPYRVLRHPAYTGGVITMTGIGLAMGNWISLAGAFVCILMAYGWRIIFEEKALRARFGEAFEAHRKRTWAVIPFLW
jgi:protein-S-isoprenylcysteine O-methyltransferase